MFIARVPGLLEWVFVLYYVNLVGTLSLVYLCGYLVRNPHPPNSPIYYNTATINCKLVFCRFTFRCSPS
jgi:hypothetical protein